MRHLFPLLMYMMPLLLRPLFPVKNSKWGFNPHGFVAWALGRIGPDAKDAVPQLAKTLHGPDLWARRPAAWALARMGAEARPATAELIRALASGSGGAWSATYNAQFHAADALANIGESAVPALTAALGAKGAAARRGAAMALGKLGPAGKPAGPRLAKLLADKDELVRIEAAMALGRVDPDLCARHVPALLNDDNYALRHAAARSLGQCGAAGAPAVTALAKALSDKRREVRRSVFDALRQVGPEAAEVLVCALGDKSDRWGRCHAARALGKAGRTAVGPLMKALKDGSAEVRREATWSLAELGPLAASSS